MHFHFLVILVFTICIRFGTKRNSPRLKKNIHKEKEPEIWELTYSRIFFIGCPRGLCHIVAMYGGLKEPFNWPLMMLKGACPVVRLNSVVVIVAESPVSLRWRGWGVQAGASLPRENRRRVRSSGTPPPLQGAATNPQVPGSSGIVRVTGQFARGQFTQKLDLFFEKY